MFKNLYSKKIVTNVVLLLIVAFLFTPNIANAKPMIGCEIPVETPTYKPIKIKISLPGITEKEVETVGIGKVNEYYVKNLQCFTIGIYTYLVGVIGILATVMIMYGGVKFLVSGGNPTIMSGAKDTIFSAAVGLVLVLGAYILLNLINPNLTELKVAGLDPIKSAAWPTCTLAAIPDVAPNPLPHTWCGDTGQDNGEQCRYMYCGGDQLLTCVKRSLTSYSDDNYDCINQIVACTRINDDEGNLQEDPRVCDEYTQPGVGLCKWFNFPLLSGRSEDDRCLWHPVTNCPNATWQQVGCDKCLDPVNGVQGNDRFKCETLDSPKSRVCEASSSTVVYARDAVYLRLATEEPEQTICCEKKSNATGDYPVGSKLCSKKHYYPGNLW